MSPKVFVSHASEDKDRFVLKFAEQLRHKGVDAWLDKWEMLPGDSLVDKIFEEGIKEANAVIVVLSKFSVAKPWIREELNAAFIKRINNGSKLIPILIDDCKVPEALSSTVWETIDDLSSYESNLERIVASIYGVSSKPAIGKKPSYMDSFGSTIDGLSNIDTLVLRLSCETALEKESLLIHPWEAFEKNGEVIIPLEELENSLEFLNHKGYIKLIRTLGSSLYAYTLTTYGFNIYLNEVFPNYQQIMERIVFLIINEKLDSNIEIHQKIQVPLIIISHVFDVLESKGLIKQVKLIGGLSQIVNISPILKRTLQ